jgi:hypothetical protein
VTSPVASRGGEEEEERGRGRERERGRPRSFDKAGDDKDFLVRKMLGEERARSGRERARSGREREREKGRGTKRKGDGGDDAELFMDIIGEYYGGGYDDQLGTGGGKEVGVGGFI